LSVSVVVEKKGRVVIPSNIRRRLGIKAGMELMIDVEGGGILMRPKRKVSAKDLLGIAGKEHVNLEEVEDSLASNS
jgi:AbrB family looped-hinge helix DNA binding protein